jgi:predicted nucleic acid-binding protein
MAGDIAAALHSKGKTLPLTDIVIAVACISGDALLWTHDSDFDRIRSVAPLLRLYQPAG